MQNPTCLWRAATESIRLLFIHRLFSFTDILFFGPDRIIEFWAVSFFGPDRKIEFQAVSFFGPDRTIEFQAVSFFGPDRENEFQAVSFFGPDRKFEFQAVSFFGPDRENEFQAVSFFGPDRTIEFQAVSIFGPDRENEFQAVSIFGPDREDEAVSSLPSETSLTLIITIEGMMCNHCERAVKNALEAIPEVTHAEADFNKGTALVQLSGPVDHEVLKAAVEAEDYPVLDIQEA